MSCSKKNHLLSRLFLILFVVETISGLISCILLLWFFANSIPKNTMILLIILIGIIWFVMAIILIVLYMRFKGKYLAAVSSELGLRDILETNMDLVEYDPLQMLPKQTLLNCSAIFPNEFFDGTINCYGSQLIRGKYNDKPFEMSSVKLVFTRNTAGQPSVQYFDGTIVILHSKAGADSYVQYLFPKNDRSNYKEYVLRNANLKKVMPPLFGDSWECFSHNLVEARQFFDEHSDWFSCVYKNNPTRFIIHSHSCVIMGIAEKLFEENHDAAFMREHFEKTLKRILTCCVDSFE